MIWLAIIMIGFALAVLLARHGSKKGRNGDRGQSPQREARSRFSLGGGDDMKKRKNANHYG
jgi:hypothetical protein